MVLNIAQGELDALLAEMEEQVVGLATAAESAHAQRCDPNVISESACGDQNYHACGTELPNPQCHAGFQHRSAGSCSVVKDYTASTVNIKDVTQRDQPNQRLEQGDYLLDAVAGLISG